MENNQLKQRISDLEKSLKRVKESFEEVKSLDNSHIETLSFEEGFKHAINLFENIINVNVDYQLLKAKL